VERQLGVVQQVAPVSGICTGHVECGARLKEVLGRRVRPVQSLPVVSYWPCLKEGLDIELAVNDRRGGATLPRWRPPCFSAGPPQGRA
jgi:hypothetical protein